MAKLPPMEERDGSAARANAADAADWVTVPSRDGHVFQIPPEIGHLAPPGAPWTELEALLRPALRERERQDQAERTRRHQLEHAAKRARREQTKQEQVDRRLRRLEEQALRRRPTRDSNDAADDAVARMVRVETRGSTETDWKLADQYFFRIEGRAKKDRKRRRMRDALRRVPRL
jgi:hypothetical protein